MVRSQEEWKRRIKLKVVQRLDREQLDLVMTRGRILLDELKRRGSLPEHQNQVDADRIQDEANKIVALMNTIGGVMNARADVVIGSLFEEEDLKR